MSLKPYLQYKESGVAWVGQIPHGWNIERLSWLFGIISSGTTPSSDSNEYYGGDVNWVTTGELRESVIWDTKRKVTTHAVLSLPALRVYEPGTLLIAMYGATIGRLGILGVPATTNQACCAFSDPTVSTDPQFVYYSLTAAKNHLLDIADGGGQPNINQDKLRSLRIALPPLPEQHKIAEYLDRETAEIDAFIGDQEELIVLLKERRAATITKAVTKGLDPTAKMMDSGLEWMGEVPESWTVAPLRRLVSSSLKYGANESADSDNPEWIRYLRITDFDTGGKLREGTFRSLPPEVAKDYMTAPGDVLLARSGATVGKAFLVPEDAPPSCFAGYLIRVETDRNMLIPSFFYAYTQSVAFSSWRDSAFVMATIQNIGADRYASLPVVCPPLCEQETIVDYLNLETAEIDATIADARESIGLSKERRAALISAVVTGKIDVCDAFAVKDSVLEGESVGAA